MRKLSALLVSGLLLTSVVKAQSDSTSDLMKELQNNTPASKDHTTAAFKTTRIVTAQSIENLPAGVLDLRFSHRFGKINSGAKTLFGLDESFVRIGLEYGISNRLMAGIGRSNIGREFDGFLKYKLLRQTTDGKMPVSVSIFSSATVNTVPFSDVQRNKDYSSRWSSAHQLLIARKFNESTTLQFTTSYVYTGVPFNPGEPNHLFLLGLGGRHKISKRVSINAEYYYQLRGGRLSGSQDALSVGVDIETGGHVFQLIFSNSRLMNEKAYLSETTGKWDDGDIHFGFNISRVFTVRKPRK